MDRHAEPQLDSLSSTNSCLLKIEQVYRKLYKLYIKFRTIGLLESLYKVSIKFV